MLTWLFDCEEDLSNKVMEYTSSDDIAHAFINQLFGENATEELKTATELLERVVDYLHSHALNGFNDDCWRVLWNVLQEWAYQNM